LPPVYQLKNIITAITPFRIFRGNFDKIIMNLSLKMISRKALAQLCCVALLAAAVFLGTDVTPGVRAQVMEAPLGGRTMTIVSTNGAQGSQAVVSIELDSQGDETSASFSLNFDPAILTNPVVALGSGVPPGTNLGVNPNQIATGRLGILVDSTSTYAISPPNRQMVTVTFTIPSGAPLGATPITFVTNPTPLSVSSAMGALLPTVYQVGTVTVTEPTVQLVTVGGRVTTPAGQNLRNAIVNLIDSTGARRVATTSSFGLYSFSNVATGQTYTFTITSKRYRFTPRVIDVNGAISNLDFVGLE
jgi:Cohesin domain